MEPVKPKRRDRLPVGADWRYEIKLDGFRGLLHVEDGRGYFLSKNVNRMERFQSLADTLAAVLKVKSAILDGEIIAVRQERVDFYALMFGRGRPQYAAFDLLWLNGRDLRGQAYRSRRAALRELPGRQDAIGYVDNYLTPELLEAAIRLDMEGVVAKRESDLYGPENEWVKVKHPSYTQMAGRWELFKRR